MTEEEVYDWSFEIDVTKLQSLVSFWNKRANEIEDERDFYKEEARQTQEILGRVISQYSERWDTVKLTNYPRKRLN